MERIGLWILIFGGFPSITTMCDYVFSNYFYYFCKKSKLWCYEETEKVVNGANCTFGIRE